MFDESGNNLDNTSDMTENDSTEKSGGYKSKGISKLYFTQILATASYVFILLIMGVPLWWKLTEVKRSYFPYNDIHNLTSQNIRFLLNIYIHTQHETAANRLIAELPALSSNLSIFDIDIKLADFNNLKISNISYLESLNHIHPTSPGSLLLLEVPSLMSSQIIMSKHRTMYFPSNTKSEEIYSALREVVFLEEEIIEAMETITSPGFGTNSINQLRRVRPNNHYDIVFTTVYSEPRTYDLKWDQEIIINKYFKQFLEHLSSVAEFTLKSHWLFDVDLYVTPAPIINGTDKYHVFTYNQIPQIITPLENRLGSGVAKNPSIHFILYTTKCKDSPIYFADKNYSRSLAALSARWGGIQILNPRKQHCNNSKPLVPNGKTVMDIFITQFRLLFGLRNYAKTLSTVPLDETLSIRKWELDILYRIKITEFFISSKLTLSSLSKLLGEISNIVITEEVSEAVIEAVYAVQNVLIYSKNGALDMALNYSKQSFVKSEYGFTHPSLLALLYFPDDQKYAVYIPLYLPVMIPVIMSFDVLISWIRNFWKTGNITEAVITEDSSDEHDEDENNDDKKHN